MKSITQIFLLFVVSNVILSSLNFARNHLIYQLEKEQIGVSSNLGNGNVEAISYGIAATKSDQFFINNQKGYVTANYVNTLPPRQPIAGGQIETVEEVNFPVN